MELLNEPIPDVLELRAHVFEDPRGSFSETFSRRTMAGGLTITAVDYALGAKVDVTRRPELGRYGVTTLIPLD